MIVYLAQDIPAFVMYCVYGESRSSLPYRVYRLYDKMLSQFVNWYTVSGGQSGKITVISIICEYEEVKILFLLQESFQSVLYESVEAVVDGLAVDSEVALTVTTGDPASSLLSLMHAFWLHGNIGILLLLPA